MPAQNNQNRPQDKISSIIKIAMEKQNSRDIEDGLPQKQRMNATRLSQKTGISPDKIDRYLNGKFVRPIKREDLNRIIDVLNIKDGATLRSLNSMLKKSSKAASITKEQGIALVEKINNMFGEWTIWNEYPELIDNMFDVIKQRVLDNEFAIIKSTNDSIFPASFNYDKRLTIFDMKNYDQLSGYKNMYLNFCIGENCDANLAFEQMRLFFIDDLKNQCLARDEAANSVFTEDELDRYFSFLAKANITIYKHKSKNSCSQSINSNTIFISVFDDYDTYISYVNRCRGLHLSSFYLATFIDTEKCNMKYAWLKHGYEEQIFRPFQ